MAKKLLEDFNCKICNRTFNRSEGLTKHLKQTHQVDPIKYTIQYLLDGKIPKCKCGCNQDVKVSTFKTNEYCLGHTGGGLWQNKYDKNSEEYKQITEKISTSVKEYIQENPIIVSQETREKQSKYMKELLSDENEKRRRFTKMKETKKKQSEDGILSERHWTKKLTEEELDEKLKEIGLRISIGKRNNTKPAWNSGLTNKTDDRIDKWSGENNYRYNPDRSNEYSRKFRNKEFRKLILEHQDGICFECKKNDGRQLCLHHVDENKKNDSYNNLIFVCRSCHVRLHSIKLFMNNFREKVLLFKESLAKQNFN